MTETWHLGTGEFRPLAPHGLAPGTLVRYCWAVGGAAYEYAMVVPDRDDNPARLWIATKDTEAGWTERSSVRIVPGYIDGILPPFILMDREGDPVDPWVAINAQRKRDRFGEVYGCRGSIPLTEAPTLTEGEARQAVADFSARWSLT